MARKATLSDAATWTAAKVGVVPRAKGKRTKLPRYELAVATSSVHQERDGVEGWPSSDHN
jgi:hypothetical protein